MERARELHRNMTPAEAGSTSFSGSALNYTFQVAVADNVGNTNSQTSGVYNTASVTKYYLFGGQRVATPALVTAGASVRKSNDTESAVYYLHGDHLGSVSLITDASGAILAQSRNSAAHPEYHPARIEMRG